MEVKLESIPDGWESTTLGNLCGRITTGKLDANAMVADGDYPFFTCARENYWIDKYAFDGEALLVSGNGANVGYVHYYNGKFNAYQRTYDISEFSADVHFIKLFLDRNVQERIRVEVNAGNTPYITMGTLTEMGVTLPRNREEQRAIALALNDVDALLGALDRLIAKKRDLKQAAMQQLLTGNKRLPGFTSQWEVKRLGDVCRITTGKKDVNEGNPSGQYPFFTCARTNTFSDSYSFDGEAILIAGNGEVGNLSYCNGRFEAYQRTYVLQNFTANVSYLWQQLSAYLASTLGIGKIGSSIPYIRMGNLVGFEFPSPIDVPEQTAIAAVLSDMDAEIAALEQRRDKTRALKQGMMQELLTGRIRLV